MKPKDFANAPGRTPVGGPLADLVDDELNTPLAEQVAAEIDGGAAGPSRSGTTDYAHGTAEHEDDHEA